DVAARDARREALLAEIRAIDPNGLGSEGARLAQAIAKNALERWQATRVCRYELWLRLGQMVTGWQVRLSSLAEAQPMGTPALRTQALTRFSAVPAYADAQIEALRKGLELGYTQPK